jgi:hypothetical protein
MGIIVGGTGTEIRTIESVLYKINACKTGFGWRDLVRYEQVVQRDYDPKKSLMVIPADLAGLHEISESLYEKAIGKEHPKEYVMGMINGAILYLS